MDKKDPIYIALKKITDDIRFFIELSMQETDTKWEEWWSLVVKDIEIRCWEKKNCIKRDCPAYMNTCGRCWLIAGTLCSGEVQGEFALQYKSCTDCNVYQEAVNKDSVTQIYENLITLVHSLRLTQKRLKTMSTRDLLTGAYNRNYFNEVIKSEIERTKRYNKKLSIIMADIDNFKQINDKYGHLHGDGVLKECALLLNKSIRASDLLIRFGGDEFLIIMPETDCAEGNALISRINTNISEWNEEYASSDYSLSFSLRCAAFKNGKDLIEVIKEAENNDPVGNDQKNHQIKLPFLNCSHKS
ncbi:MAG: GGDEF domain-containing protein [Nitrospirae bacterium]|nr:GGDEF domain-containing protein [Nitrospirota bacterium]